jgi:hypothetical protein
MDFRYKCKKCDKKYHIYSSLYSHVLSNHLEKRVQCSNCKLMFKTHNDLYKHAYLTNCKFNNIKEEQEKVPSQFKTNPTSLSDCFAFQM